MLQIFITLFILSHSLIMITNPNAPRPQIKVPCLTFLILNASNILTKKINLQPEDLPQATAIATQPLIACNAQPIQEKTHVYNPTACRHFITDTIQKHMVHR